MVLPAQSYETALQAPFVVELRRKDVLPNGDFVPDAVLRITPALRTSGLLYSLAAEDLRTLLLVLTFVTPNGQILPSLTELLPAMGGSEPQARALIRRLSSLSWRERPLLYEVPRESGLDAVAPSPAVLAVTHAPEIPAQTAELTYRAAGREAVISYSRARYARPRAEVEQEIAELNGWSERQVPTARNTQALPPDPETAAVLQQLLQIGVASDTAHSLLQRFPLESIQKQITWLSARRATYPARLLVAAIEHGYGAPRLPVDSSTQGNRFTLEPPFPPDTPPLPTARAEEQLTLPS